MLNYLRNSVTRRYRYRYRYNKLPKSTAAGLHINIEGIDDPTGEAGGGYDVRIRTGIGNHLIFIQYKTGKKENGNLRRSTLFATGNIERFSFGFNNNNRKDQHILLRHLQSNAGANLGNAVLYAFPLVETMTELEQNAGQLLRKTKFISIPDIDKLCQDNGKTIVAGTEHKFRITTGDFSKCEVNFFFFFFNYPDRTPDVVSDFVCINFVKHLRTFLQSVAELSLSNQYLQRFVRLPIQLERRYFDYILYLCDYFQVTPAQIDIDQGLNFLERFIGYVGAAMSEDFRNEPHDVSIVRSIVKKLAPYHEFILGLNELEVLSSASIPEYNPTIFFQLNEDFDVSIPIGFDIEDINDISFLKT